MSMDANLSDIRDIRLDSYLHVFALDREIKFVWMRPKKPSTYWFLANRYFLASVNIVVTLFEFMPFKFLKVLVAVLMALRVYALYGCSSRVLGSMVIIEAANVSIWALFVGQEPTVSQSTFGCQIGLSWSLAAWVAMFAYDSIIFALTLMKTWRAAQSIEIRARWLPISTLLLRDGAIYFAHSSGVDSRDSQVAICSISVTMMSRIMLNLHETAGAGIFSTQDNVSRLEFLNDSELVESELPRMQENVREVESLQNNTR
ncbi:hypothetical protein BD779DRAFT_1475846 [Infundibulicybe gibba]|nr:hypothetical protein BD779DRAFT_1475846 [Infundibulicybe gibba]